MNNLAEIKKAFQRKIQGHSYNINIVIAIIIGTMGGSFAVLYRLVIEIIKNLFSYQSLFYSPAAGALLAGLVIHFGARNARGHGIPVVIESVKRHGGRMTPRGLLTEGLASALTIGSGGSAGRVGPIVEIGAGIGSLIGQALKDSEEYLKTFLACGAAAGIAAIFNAPVAGVFFSLEVLLEEMKSHHLSLIIISSLTADIIARGILGDSPAFLLPAVQPVANLELTFFVPLGIIAALIGELFIWFFFSADKVFRRMPINNLSKPFLGGLIVGILGIWFPQIMGVGFEPIEDMLWGRINFIILPVLLLLKIIATSITLGSGASGGVFAPLLFIGAALGEAWGGFLSHLFPGWIGFPAAYVFAGMGGMISAAINAPVFAVILMFEITRNYNLVLPLLVTCVIASIVSTRIERGSIYTRKVEDKGLILEK